LKWASYSKIRKMAFAGAKSRREEAMNSHYTFFIIQHVPIFSRKNLFAD
jgi:hypothetical protein